MRRLEALKNTAARLLERAPAQVFRAARDRAGNIVAVGSEDGGLWLLIRQQSARAHLDKTPVGLQAQHAQPQIPGPAPDRSRWPRNRTSACRPPNSSTMVRTIIAAKAVCPDFFGALYSSSGCLSRPWSSSSNALTRKASCDGLSSNGLSVSGSISFSVMKLTGLARQRSKLTACHSATAAQARWTVSQDPYGALRRPRVASVLRLRRCVASAGAGRRLARHKRDRPCSTYPSPQTRRPTREPRHRCTPAAWLEKDARPDFRIDQALNDRGSDATTDSASVA